MFQFQVRKLTPHTASPGPGLSSGVTSPSLRPDGTPDVFHAGFPPQGMIPLSNTGPLPINSHHPPNDQVRTALKAEDGAHIRSPFRDCLDTFGTFPTQLLARPPEGFVNGYIKFTWGKDTQPGTFIPGAQPNGEMTPLDLSLPAGASNTSHIPGIPPYNALAQLLTDFPTIKSETPSPSPTNLSDIPHGGMDLTNIPKRESQSSSPVSSTAIINYQNDPQMLPPQFGFQAKVDSRMDRRFWQFCKLINSIFSERARPV